MTWSQLCVILSNLTLYIFCLCNFVYSFSISHHFSSCHPLYVSLIIGLLSFKSHLAVPWDFLRDLVNVYFPVVSHLKH